MPHLARLLCLALISGCGASAAPHGLVPWTAAPIAAPLPPGEPALAPGTNTALPPAPVGALPVAATPASGPLTFEAAAPDGRWLVTCQARKDTNGDGRVEVLVGESGELTGDTLVRYLTFASGGEQEIDALLAASADGRWLAFEREGRSELYDTDTGARVDLSALGADTGREPAPARGHRTLAFDEDRLFYVRVNGQVSEVVERRLATTSERTLYRGAEAIVRLDLDRGGKKLVLELTGTDSNKNGRSDFPHALEHGKAPCLGPVPRFLVERQNADARSRLVVDRASGEAVRVDDLAAIAGETLLRRDAEGALFADGKRGRRQLADKACSARVLWIDATSEELLLGCALPKRPGRLGVEFFGRAGRKPLEIDVAQLSFDEPAAEPARLVALYPGADTVLFDVEKQFLHRLKPGDAVLGQAGRYALIRRGRTAFVFDADAGTLSALTGRLDPLGELLQRGTLVFVSPLLVDLVAGRVLGVVSGRALALANTGQVLVPAQAATSTALAEGPLTWQTVAAPAP